MEKKSVCWVPIVPYHDSNIIFSYIKALCNDNGGEFINTKFKAYFQQNGLIYETSYPQNP